MGFQINERALASNRPAAAARQIDVLQCMPNEIVIESKDVDALGSCKYCTFSQAPVLPQAAKKEDDGFGTPFRERREMRALCRV